MDKGNSSNCLFSPVDLPCGRQIQNRLVKVSLYEHLAKFLGGPPNAYHYALYSTWSKGGWGMIFTGNVQVSDDHLTLGRDVVIPRTISDDTLASFKSWADSIHGPDAHTRENGGVLAVMQLSHAGRQSINFIGGRAILRAPLAPSAVRVQEKKVGWLSDALHALAFQTPRAMTMPDVDELVEAFSRGAKVAHMSGFDGVEIHAAHGYLLAQFISPKSNIRTDEYSSSTENVLRLLHRIVSSVRAVVPNTFILGIKMNAADYVTGKGDETVLEDEQRVLHHIRCIAGWGMVDFIEVSGGDYENPAFATTESSRQALFSRFSRAALKTLCSFAETQPQSRPLPLVLLTGGLRTPEIMSTAISANHAELLGVGRASVLCPDLPSRLKQFDLVSNTSSTSDWSKPFFPEPDLRIPRWIQRFFPSIPLVGAGVNMSWYGIIMRRLATKPSPYAEEMVNGLQPEYGLGPGGTVLRFWIWVGDDIFSYWYGLVPVLAIFTAVAKFVSGLD